MTSIDVPRFVDSHAHLDDAQFTADIAAVIASAASVGVDRIVNIGYRPGVWRSTLALSAEWPGVSCTLGLHPNHADEASPALWAELGRLIDEHAPVAIGEIGIDLFRDHVPLRAQIHAFERQLLLAAERALPVVIHQRAADAEVVASLRQAPPALRCIHHSFDGGRELLDFAIERGDYIGVGGLMTRAGSTTLRASLAKVPLDRLLLETDSPYLVPSGVKARRNQPSNIPLIARALAGVKDVTLAEIAAHTTANAERALPLLASAPLDVSDRAR